LEYWRAEEGKWSDHVVKTVAAESEAIGAIGVSGGSEDDDRACGDAACFPINHLHNAVRQAAGRAFAAEFLAPIDEIRTMKADKHDIVTIANAFCVSTTVIERQIENEQRIRAALN
jgi:hypothetical protein